MTRVFNTEATAASLGVAGQTSFLAEHKRRPTAKQDGMTAWLRDEIEWLETISRTDRGDGALSAYKAALRELETNESAAGAAQEPKDVEALLRRLAALAVNQLSGQVIFDEPVTGERLRRAAIDAGLFQFDDLHHAPRCPANHFHQKRLPTGCCTCGAVTNHSQTAAIQHQPDMPAAPAQAAE